MKILLTVHQFFPQFASGTEVLTFSVARDLLMRGHQVHVLTGHPTDQALRDEDRFDEYDYEGIHVYRFHHAYTPMGGQTSMLELSYDNSLAATYFETILDKLKPDVVHFFHLNRLGTRLIEHAVQAGIPAFMTPTDFWAVCSTSQLLLCNGSLCTGPSAYAGNCVKHFAQSVQKGVIGTIAEWLPTPLVDILSKLTQAGMLPSYPYRNEVRAIGSRLGINIARLNQLCRIIAPNGLMAELLNRHGVFKHLITQSAYGIDLNGIEADAPRPKPRQPLRVGFIGTIALYKGCHILIEAFKALPPGRAVLKIYGNRADFPEYANTLEQLAGSNRAIEFCGIFHNSKIAEVFSDLDVLVVPSLWFENTPLVIYSAQASRCPVVASNFPGMAGIIRNEENGLLFEAGNVAALVKQLSRLIDEPGLAERLSTNATQPKSTVLYVDELLEIWKLYIK